MEEKAFERLAIEEWEKIPERFNVRIKNLALVIADELDSETRAGLGLETGDTLLGLYQGIPITERGVEYGEVLPDSITLYRMPIIEAAGLMDGDITEAIRKVVRETIWHEVGHYFGMSEEEIHFREEAETNKFT